MIYNSGIAIYMLKFALAVLLLTMIAGMLTGCKDAVRPRWITPESSKCYPLALKLYQYRLLATEKGFRNLEDRWKACVNKEMEELENDTAHAGATNKMDDPNRSTRVRK